MTLEIYKATNKINGYSYIGYAIEGLKERKPDHEWLAKNGSNCYFHKALRKYGFDNFDWIILEHNISDFEILKDLEKYWIREFGTKAPKGYNLTDGGDGSLGCKPTKEVIRKRKETRTKNGWWKNPIETKYKISISMKGKKAWNKGLTKETDDRVRKNTENSIFLKRKWSENIFDKAIELKEKGMSYYKISKVLEVPAGTIYNWVKKQQRKS